MNALDALENLKRLDKQIEALDSAYTELWRDFDCRWMAVEIEKIKVAFETERGEIADKLRAVQL